MQGLQHEAIAADRDNDRRLRQLDAGITLFQKRFRRHRLRRTTGNESNLHQRSPAITSCANRRTATDAVA
ncbi:MAG: hypothetical protein BWZ07_01848 [Alphaproteobacteria bacterium ADurb.BinA280]|nr:MAG: hypothetical protein BWZ07_01848 [Alphaproteobacteria bacterium ADurb.BinA280]